MSTFTLQVHLADYAHIHLFKKVLTVVYLWWNIFKVLYWYFNLKQCYVTSCNSVNGITLHNVALILFSTLQKANSYIYLERENTYIKLRGFVCFSDHSRRWKQLLTKTTSPQGPERFQSCSVSLPSHHMIFMSRWSVIGFHENADRKNVDSLIKFEHLHLGLWEDVHAVCSKGAEQLLNRPWDRTVFVNCHFIFHFLEVKQFQ